MVLLDLLANLYPEKTSNPAWIVGFQAIHVHHGLSPHADRWALFCADECARRGVRFDCICVQVDRSSGEGVEASARRARYQALGRATTPYIATAQHLDDQAETVLHQLLRGTGAAGLAAMGPSRLLASGQTLLRPLLSISRREIETYAREQGLRWVEDESNADIAYSRNYIRHTLMPLVTARFPEAAQALARAARHAHESVGFSEALAKIDLRWDGEYGYADLLDTLPKPRQLNALYHWLRWQDFAGAPAPTQAQIETWAAQLFRAAPESKPHQAGGHGLTIRRVKHRLLLAATP